MRVAEARHLAEELRRKRGEERRLRSVLSFHARQVFDMPQ